jgi:hypothetical protein
MWRNEGVARYLDALAFDDMAHGEFILAYRLGYEYHLRDLLKYS